MARGDKGQATRGKPQLQPTVSKHSDKAQASRASDPGDSGGTPTRIACGLRTVNPQGGRPGDLGQEPWAMGQITRGSGQGTGGMANCACRQGTSTWGQRPGRLRWHPEVYRVRLAHGIITGEEAW